MNEAEFKHEMSKAESFQELAENSEYWKGYARGLRRNYHGENFGTEEEHQQWLNLVNDPTRKEMGDGYRAGLYCRRQRRT